MSIENIVFLDLFLVSTKTLKLFISFFVYNL